MSITIKTTPDCITVQMPYSKANYDACRSIPHGWWNSDLRAWCYPKTEAKTIAERFYGQDLYADHEFDELVKRSGPEVPTTDFIDVCPPALVKTEPWRHQCYAYNLIEHQRATMLAHDMGTGKSKVIVDSVVNLGFKRTLIVCPKTVVNVWPAEFATHAAGPVDVVPLGEGSVADRAVEAKRQIKLAQIRGTQLVLVVNYDSVWRVDLAKVFESLMWELIVCDESHRIKSHVGRASKFMWRLGKLAVRRVCLTGTPLPRSLLCAFGQYRFLDQSIFGPYFTAFRHRYAVMGGYSPQGPNGRPVQVVGFQNLDEFRQKFGSIAHQVRKEDVLDLPEAVHETREVELSAAAWGHYRRLEREFVTAVEEGLVTVANAAVRVGKLQQVTSGFLKVDPEEVRGEDVYSKIDAAKADALKELLEDLPADEPVVVFCHFRHEMDVLKGVVEQTGRVCYSLRGGCNELNNWQVSNGGEVLIVQMQSGGLGVDCTRSAYVVFCNLPWTPGAYDQCHDRAHRPGQTRSVTYIHLVAKGTIDERIYEALRQKRKVIEAVLEGLGRKETTDV